MAAEEDLEGLEGLEVKAADDEVIAEFWKECVCGYRRCCHRRGQHQVHFGVE